MRAALSLMAVLAPVGPAAAFEPPLPPSARAVVDSRQTAASVPLPVTRLQAGEVQAIRAEGAVRRRVWQVPSPGITTLQLIAPIRDALREDGFQILLECAAARCGGFDFRFETDAVPPPEMYVDLGDYRYLAAQRTGADGPRWRQVIVSRTPERGFVQVTAVEPAPPAPSEAEAGSLPDEADEARGGLAERIEAEGHAVLWDLDFQTGETALGPGPFAALEELAAYLRARPEARVVLVGHTDTEGALAANIDLSRLRARATRDRLVADYGIAADRLGAEGVGFLAPVAPNVTAEGRERNRRVEVVLAGP